MSTARDGGDPAAPSAVTAGRVTVVHDAGLGGPDRFGTPALRVYTPAGYDDPERTEERYPVLYLLDGQNAFDRETPARGSSSWGVDSTFDQLIAQRRVPRHLVVALDHRGADRIGDYSPWRDARLRFEPRGALTAAYLTERVVPFVDARYRTLASPEHRTVGGSSLGGLMALYLGFTRRDVFSRVAALSPSVMWADRGMFRLWSRRPSEELVRIYLDVGSRELFCAGPVELEYGTDVREFHAHLESLGYGTDELRFVLDPRGGHDERSWRRRLPDALRWLLAG